MKQISDNQVTTYAKIGKKISNQICQNVSIQAASYNPILIMIPSYWTIWWINLLSGHDGQIYRKIISIK